jgi:hypothetical protein
MYPLKDGDIIRLGECVFLQFKMPLSDSIPSPGKAWIYKYMHTSDRGLCF